MYALTHSETLPNTGLIRTWYRTERNEWSHDSREAERFPTKAAAREIAADFDPISRSKIEIIRIGRIRKPA